MTFDPLFEPLQFKHGRPMKNRFRLAPLTNLQSESVGVLSDQEIHWLTMRAEGGFGLVMTAGSYVQLVGRGFPGQLGSSGDEHIPGLTRLAERLHSHGALACLQLWHAGTRVAADLAGQAVGPSDDAETSTRGLSIAEVEQARDDFASAALRAEKAGFDGVEIDGAHGYFLGAFLSEQTNRRNDRYGGSPEHRARLLFEVIDRIREETGPDFQLGLRLSAERFYPLAEILTVCRRALAEAKIDYLDLSLFDFRKEPVEEQYAGRSLASFFSELPRGDVRLSATGRVQTPTDAIELLEAGFDMVTLGRGGILNHDFPNRLKADPDYAPATGPGTPEHLSREGVGAPFMGYLSRRYNFVANPATSQQTPG